MTPLESLRAALQEDNVRAFLMMIRHGEGTSDGLGYSRMFGGAQFDSFTDHPRKAQTYKMGKTGKTLTSTAAGAYQFLSRTWDGLVKQYGFTDFTPESQDLGAIALIKGRGALPDVIAGNFESAVSKCNKEWASLPGSPYGQPVVRMDHAKEAYINAGGIVINQPAQPPKETTVSPFIVPAISAVIDLLPKLGTIFGSGSDVSNRNIKAVEMVIDTAKEAIGARNEQELAEAIKSDPAAAASVKAAVEAKWFELTEVGGGVESARKAEAAYLQPGTKGFWHSPVFWISLILLVMPFMLLADVFYVHPDNYVGDIRTQIITGLLAVIMMVGGYWIGTSASSQRKDELAAQQRQ